MTYEEFALLAANKGLRVAWDAMNGRSTMTIQSPLDHDISLYRAAEQARDSLLVHGGKHVCECCD